MKRKSSWTKAEDRNGAASSTTCQRSQVFQSSRGVSSTTLLPEAKYFLLVRFSRANEGAPVAGRNSSHSNAGARVRSSARVIGLSRFFGSRISTRRRKVLAIAVSTRITVAASAWAWAASAPRSSSMRATCSTYFSRFSFDFASSLR